MQKRIPPGWFAAPEQIQENHLTSPIPDVRNRRRDSPCWIFRRLRTSGIGLREALPEPVVWATILPARWGKGAVVPHSPGFPGAKLPLIAKFAP